MPIYKHGHEYGPALPIGQEFVTKKDLKNGGVTFIQQNFFAKEVIFKPKIKIFTLIRENLHFT